jgi:Rrf2 family transcriptional regulator, cysteine metabolism repressor
MKLTARGYYGLRAMAQLAKAYGQGPQSLSEIARAESIPPAFLEQIMSVLRKAALVEASRGAYGGYELVRSPETISAGDVVRALEGPLFLAACVGGEDHAGNCGRESACTTKNMWLRLRDSIANVLDSTSLADLGEEPAPVDSAPIRN